MTDISFYCNHCGQHLDAPLAMAGDPLDCPSCGKQIQVPGAEAVAPPETVVAPETAQQKGSLFGRIVAGVIGGLIMGTLAANTVTLMFAEPNQEDPSTVATVLGGIVFFGLWITGIVVAVRASRPAKAWRRLLIPNGILSLIIPFAAIVATVRAAGSVAAKGGEMAEIEAGAYAVGGVLFAVVLGFFGVILAAVFLTVGLLVGKEPKQQD